MNLCTCHRWASVCWRLGPFIVCYESLYLSQMGKCLLETWSFHCVLWIFVPVTDGQVSVGDLFLSLCVMNLCTCHRWPTCFVQCGQQCCNWKVDTARKCNFCTCHLIPLCYYLNFLFIFLHSLQLPLTTVVRIVTILCFCDGRVLYTQCLSSLWRQICAMQCFLLDCAWRWSLLLPRLWVTWWWESNDWLWFMWSLVSLVR